MTPHRPALSISALPPGQEPVPDSGGEVIDLRVYRTELTRDTAGTGWTLKVDASTVAWIDEPMEPTAAARWACREMGEGVVFLNGLVGEPADSGYWVANPIPQRRQTAGVDRPRGGTS